MSKGPPPDILVVAPSWVGDAVMSHCLIRAINAEAPEVAIDVLAADSVAPVYRRMPEVRAVVRSPFRHEEFGFLGRLRQGRALAGRYGRAYILPGSWKSALAPFAAGVARRSGYLREARWGLLNDPRPLPEALRRRTAVAFQALAEPRVAFEASWLRPPKLTADAANRDAQLQAYGLVNGEFAAFFPGAEYGPAKRWPTRRWIELARRLEGQGLRCALIGAPGDIPVAREIAAGAANVVDIVGRTRLEDAIDLISAARFAVTNDSGLMHVAAAIGRKVVALYGSTSPDDTPPLTHSAEVVTLKLTCSPCRKRVCPLGHLDCLERLGVELVTDALARLETCEP
jgi:heptosyltransferase-2